MSNQYRERLVSLVKSGTKWEATLVNDNYVFVPITGREITEDLLMEYKKMILKQLALCNDCLKEKGVKFG